MDRISGLRRKSGFRRRAKANRLLPVSPIPLAQSCPQPCPYPHEAEPLGEPLTIRAAARLIGCSTWTVRQKYIPSGLPYFRLGPNGRLIFYKNQVIRWLLARQQKGGPR